MTIKVIKPGQKSNKAQYKSSKVVLTPQDIKEADKFDTKLNEEISRIERILKEKIFHPKSRKKEMIWAWYLIGKKINSFLLKNRVSPEEEHIFWDSLYGRFSLVSNNASTSIDKRTKNDFRIASRMAKYPFKKIKKIGIWDLWRDIIIYKAFRDKRVLDWVILKIEHSTQTSRDQVRPFLKAISQRLKKIDTSVLSDEELIKKLKIIKWPSKTTFIL